MRDRSSTTNEISTAADDPPRDGLAQEVSAQPAGASSGVVSSLQTAPPSVMAAGAFSGPEKNFKSSNDERTARRLVQVERARALAAQGYSAAEASKLLGVGPSQAHKYSYQGGFLWPGAMKLRQASIRETHEKLRELALSGMPIREACAKVGCDPKTGNTAARALGFRWPGHAGRHISTAARKANTERTRAIWDAQSAIRAHARRTAKLGALSEAETERLIADHIANHGVTQCPPTEPASNEDWCLSRMFSPVRLRGDGQVPRR